MEMFERLRTARERAGFQDAAAAARRFSWGVSTYRSHENGQRGFRHDTAMIYARAFRVSPEWLMFGTGGPGQRPVPLVGYVGAGAEVFPFDDGGSLEDIDPPPGVGPDAVAVRVRGDSMFPRYMDGDVLIYDSHDSLRAADGQECVICLPDGRRLIKTVRVERDGSVTLESWNAPPQRDQHPEWMATIRWIRRGRT